MDQGALRVHQPECRAAPETYFEYSLSDQVEVGLAEPVLQRRLLALEDHGVIVTALRGVVIVISECPPRRYPARTAGGALQSAGAGGDVCGAAGRAGCSER